VTPFLDKPVAPNPAHYKHKTPSQSTATTSAESAAGEDELSLASFPVTISDLTADSFRTY